MSLNPSARSEVAKHFLLEGQNWNLMLYLLFLYHFVKMEMYPS